jgi:hypothetical protein
MKTFLFCLLLLINTSVFSQKPSQYDNVPLTTANEYRHAEPQVALAADYVYSSPIDKDNVHRKDAINFILKWMGGTSDYSFAVDDAMKKITNDDRDLVGVYAACISKYALEKGKGVDRDILKFNSFLLLAKYCENPDNNYKVRGEIKKLIDAKNQNKLQEYLDSLKKK